jgi:hypothetical protein
MLTTPGTNFLEFESRTLCSDRSTWFAGAIIRLRKSADFI